MIYLVVFIGLILRLITINQSLWLDEAIGAIAAREMSVYQMFESFFTVDNHPPLYYLLLKLWTSIFGYSEFSLRFPSILFSLLTIYLVYKIALLIQRLEKDDHKPMRSVGLFTYPTVAALLLAISQFNIYFSQEARMYSMAAFFASLLVYFFIKLYTVRVSWFYMLGFSLALLCLGTTDYLPYFLILTIALFALVKKSSWKWLFNVYTCFIPLAVFWVFWFTTFSRQSQGGSWLVTTLPAWKNLAGGATLKQLILVWIKFILGRVSFVNKYVYVALAFLFSLPYATSLILAFRNRNKRGILWLWMTAPLFLSYLTSFVVPSFAYFRFLFVYPAFVLIVAWGLVNIKNELAKKLVFYSIVISALFSCIYYYGNSSQQRENWRGAVAFVEGNIQRSEVAIFEYPEPFAPYRWYEKRPAFSIGVTDSISAGSEETRDILIKTINTKTGIYYFDYLHDLSDPQDIVRKTLTEQKFSAKEIVSFSGVGQIYHYRKDSL
ncbi:MAG: hypothetical protein UT39_C0003G0015 [Candidatus Woesebacteria bacterium GW2011_GWA1_39_21]|uniref:Glycosyltransferase RgtA/B/C/D-like domain-containing protein n=1 Tax=Candidatus Woesebacteria bacterium GW2011_GWA1_39_21 TaxID=1618550 RepID=A0A0G0NG22_9BACT|nr:MAG: hypothetical protein UT39_C0003G0015 [Candidatus Woesebacteria bacterium GW2011_GWA1_39_21]